MLMSGADYRESLRRYKPRVYVNGEQVHSVADAPSLAPGVNAIALTYDYALRQDLYPLMRAGDVNRMMAIPESSQDLLNKLEAVRVLCQQTGCAQRYLGGDALAAIRMAARQLGGEYPARVAAYLDKVHGEDLTLGIAMTDGKGDRSLRPYQGRAHQDRRGLLRVLSDLLTARSGIPYEKRIEAARPVEDLTASYQGGWYSVISLHGGGSPEAMQMEIWRNYPLGNKVDLVERLLERDVLGGEARRITRNRQPGRCCVEGCMVPLPAGVPVRLVKKAS